MAAAPAPQQGQWTTGLCGCFEDLSSCCCSCCCPCIPVGQVVNVLDSGNTSCCEGGLIFCVLESLTGLGCLYTCGYRKKLRMRFGLSADPCNDFLTDCCCLCCSIAQTHRELKNRNMDPSQGYIATPPTAPPVGQFMHKG
ncbi:hypothetical protein GOP47_0007532 [Adiantum capillus-veneris]|uniref:Uncharacterized protein n=1 Tax=Adiantum capillus-veneris TaxID=13818 RepID=A0A9D4ZJB1_ADICA|nr:hypothetical protein GOP47_0007532 [Adiantum capillus-veneris]